MVSLRIAGLSFALMLSLGVSGCSKKAVKEAEELPPVEETTPEKPRALPDEPSLRGKEYQEVPEIQPVYFDLDQSSLRADARSTLQKNYQEISKHPTWEVLVEGHCDQRGTTEYNLALGQRRAASVRAYYIGLGLNGSRVATLSFGKENPTCEESTENCWAQNRRAVSKIREKGN